MWGVPAGWLRPRLIGAAPHTVTRPGALQQASVCAGPCHTMHGLLCSRSLATEDHRVLCRGGESSDEEEGAGEPDGDSFKASK